MKKQKNVATAERCFQADLSPIYFLPLVSRTVKKEVGRFQIGVTKFVFLTNPEHIRQAGRMEKQFLSRQAFNKDLLNPIIGDGIFSSSESEWIQHKKNTMRFLKPNRLNIQRWEETSKRSVVTLLEHPFKIANAIEFSREIATRTLLDNLFGSPNAIDKEKLRRCVHRMLQSSEYAALLRMFLGKHMGGRIAHPIQYLGKRAKDRMQYLIKSASSYNGSPASDPTFQNELKSILFAGQDTLTLALAYLLWLLGIHQKIQEKIRSELELYGYKSPLLKMAVMESMRLFPPLHTPAPRTALEDVVIGDIHIPAETEVMYGIWHAQRHCPNPNDFEPERFNHAEYHKIFMPFCVGPKQCSGRYLATTFLVVVVAELLGRKQIKSKNTRLSLKSMTLLEPVCNLEIELLDC